MDALEQIRPRAATSPASERALAVLAEHTAFGYALLDAVCRRRQLTLASLTEHDVRDLVNDIALQVAVFNDPEDGYAVKRALLTTFGLRRAG